MTALITLYAAMRITARWQTRVALLPRRRVLLGIDCDERAAGDGAICRGNAGAVVVCTATDTLGLCSGGASGGGRVAGDQLPGHHHTLTPPYAHRGGDDNCNEFQYIRDGKVRASYGPTAKHAARSTRESSPCRATRCTCSFGHHGIFSLTPIWLLSIIGLAMLLAAEERGLRVWALVILAVSLACIVFYIFQPLDNRNYGGMSSGFRWVFWLAPLVVALRAGAAGWPERWAAERRWPSVGRACSWGRRSFRQLPNLESVDASMDLGTQLRRSVERLPTTLMTGIAAPKQTCFGVLENRQFPAVAPPRRVA